MHSRAIACTTQFYKFSAVCWVAVQVFGRDPSVKYRPLEFRWLITAASFLCPF